MDGLDIDTLILGVKNKEEQVSGQETIEYQCVIT